VLSDFDARGLARGAVQWHVEDVRVGCSLFHLSDDVRQLCSVQPACRYSRGRIRRRGLTSFVNKVRHSNCNGTFVRMIY